MPADGARAAKFWTGETRYVADFVQLSDKPLLASICLYGSRNVKHNGKFEKGLSKSIGLAPPDVAVSNFVQRRPGGVLAGLDLLPLLCLRSRRASYSCAAGCWQTTACPTAPKNSNILKLLRPLVPLVGTIRHIISFVLGLSAFTLPAGRASSRVLISLNIET